MAVYVWGLGTQKFTIFLPPEARYEVEACMRGPNTLKRLRLQWMRLPGRVATDVVDQRQNFTHRYLLYPNPSLNAALLLPCDSLIVLYCFLNTLLYSLLKGPYSLSRTATVISNLKLEVYIINIGRDICTCISLRIWLK